MARRRPKVSSKMLITWFIITGFIFLLAPQSLTSKLQFAFADAFRVPLSFGRAFTLSSRTQEYQDVIPRRKYEQLQNHLENVYQELREERSRFEKLYGLYNRHVWEGREFVIAGIINSRTVGQSTVEFIINRGKKDGLYPGLYVIGDNSVIGVISKVSDETSTVKLITCADLKMPVKIGEIKTVIEGTGKGKAKVPLLSIKKKIEKREKVFAVEKPGYLDAPMILGYVSECKRQEKDPSLWHIEVKPVCDIDALEDVAVIIMKNKNDMSY